MAPMPPLPQQPYPDDALTTSELMPFRSKKISIWRSRALIPLAATALTCVLLFSVMGSIRGEAEILTYMRIVACFLVFAMFVGMYFYVGESKHMLWYVIPVVITWAQMLFLLRPYIFVFRTLLPGSMEGPGFVPAFIGMLFGAGLMEELLKAVPALIGLVIALRLRKTRRPGNFLTRGLALEGPVDGLLVGAAAGAAFILFETLLQYVPNTINTVMQNTKGDQGIALLFGFMLLLPRVLNGIIGHMAWAGISGYFIGLAVSHPRALPKLLLVGWLLPATLHGFWNSADQLLGKAGSYVSALLSLFFFIACILKAKQLEVSRLGGPIDGRSILAVSPAPGAAPAAPAGIVPPSAPGLAGILTAITTAVEKLVGFTARTTVPTPGTVTAGPPAPAPIPESGLSIGNGSVRYALAPDQEIDFSALFGSAGVPAGYAGLIVAAPGGGMDIRNTGSAPITVAAPDGAISAVPAGSAFRAAAGARLVLGSASLDIQAY